MVQLIAMIEKDEIEKVETLQDPTVILVMEVLPMESALAHQGFPRKRKIIMVHKTGRRLLIKITTNYIQITIIIILNLRAKIFKHSNISFRTITCETIQTTWKKETLKTLRPCRRKKIDIIPKVMG